MHKPPFRKILEPTPQYPLKILTSCSGVQEQRQLHFHRYVELCLEVSQLGGFVTEEQPIVIKTYFAERCGMPRGFRCER